MEEQDYLINRTAIVVVLNQLKQWKYRFQS